VCDEGRSAVSLSLQVRVVVDRLKLSRPLRLGPAGLFTREERDTILRGMMRGLRRYLNAALIGFIITFVIYLFVRFDPDKIVLGIVISLIGSAAALVVYIYLSKKFGGDPELFDKDGNMVDRDGRIRKARSEL
jgi:hypothetical protein